VLPCDHHSPHPHHRGVVLTHGTCLRSSSSCTRRPLTKLTPTPGVTSSAISLAAALAAIFKFAVLPGSETFVGLAIAIGLVLIPAGALSALSWQAAIFGSVASWFVPIMAPENPIAYDTLQFYNSALAIVAGAGAATLAFRLLPPLSPALRTRRLLALTLRDLRRLAWLYRRVHKSKNPFGSLFHFECRLLTDSVEKGEI
jgi:uncharacterized membrane protein YphA (DoxX/SURF4 family)